jgi:hypothetical protein
MSHLSPARAPWTLIAGGFALEGRARLGLPLGPTELWNLSGAESLRAAFRKRAGDPNSGLLPPGGRAGFTVVFLDAPSEVEGLRHSFRLEQGEPIPPLASEPPPAAEGEHEVHDVQSSDGGDGDDDLRKDKRKVRKKRGARASARAARANEGNGWRIPFRA